MKFNYNDEFKIISISERDVSYRVYTNNEVSSVQVIDVMNEDIDEYC